MNLVAIAFLFFSQAHAYPDACDETNRHAVDCAVHFVDRDGDETAWISLLRATVVQIPGAPVCHSVGTEIFSGSFDDTYSGSRSMYALGSKGEITEDGSAFTVQFKYGDAPSQARLNYSDVPLLKIPYAAPSEQDITFKYGGVLTPAHLVCSPR